MATTSQQWNRNTLARAGLFVAASTVALTASFLGLVGLLTGESAGLTDRLPFYVLVTALAFVGAIVTFEEEIRGAGRVLAMATLAGVVTFLVATFGGEGVAFLVQNHQEVVASQLLFYILAAGLIATGLGYWTLQHWTELARRRAEL